VQVKISRRNIFAAASQLQEKRLFSGFKRGVHRAPNFEPRLNIFAALTAIEFRPAGPLNTGGRFCAFRSGGVDLDGINIIANAMYHVADLRQLRMNVNNIATHS
jgi:hypothetical protein